MTAPDGVPELGPLLGRLATTGGSGSGRFPVEDLRFRMIGGLYARAGAARREMAGGRQDAARGQLSREAWLEVWRETSGAVADRLLAELDRRFSAAERESRMPVRLAQQLRPSAADRGAIRARCDAAGIPLERAPANDGSGDWSGELLHLAMALDASWERLTGTARDELAGWEGEIARVRSWRRPLQPLWALTALVVLAMVALGLSLGGYLPAPGPLAVLQRWFWSLPWR